MSMGFIIVGCVVGKIFDLRVFTLPVYGVTWMMTSFSHTGQGAQPAPRPPAADPRRRLPRGRDVVRASPHLQLLNATFSLVESFVLTQMLASDWLLGATILERTGKRSDWLIEKTVVTRTE